MFPAWTKTARFGGRARRKIEAAEAGPALIAFGLATGRSIRLAKMEVGGRKRPSTWEQCGNIRIMGGVAAILGYMAFGTYWPATEDTSVALKVLTVAKCLSGLGDGHLANWVS